MAMYVHLGPSVEWHFRRWTKHMLHARGRARYSVKPLPDRSKWKGKNVREAYKRGFGAASFRQRMERKRWGYCLRFTFASIK